MSARTACEYRGGSYRTSKFYEMPCFLRAKVLQCTIRTAPINYLNAGKTYSSSNKWWGAGVVALSLLNAMMMHHLSWCNLEINSEKIRSTGRRQCCWQRRQTAPARCRQQDEQDEKNSHDTDREFVSKMMMWVIAVSKLYKSIKQLASPSEQKLLHDSSPASWGILLNKNSTALAISTNQ